MGFVKSVNRAFKLVENHFVILNTDVELPPLWLERLIYPILNMPKVASTTPFTNSGTICSFPVFLKDNPLFENLPVEKIDYYFQYVNIDKNIIEIPTGVGFCMGFNKNVADEIGLFDEAFGKGYGEENDWCQRAIKNGYKNVLVTNLFVYHKHGGSFKSVEKQKLMEEHMRIMLSKHPEYNNEVNTFIKNDPAKSLRFLIKIKILSDLYGMPLIFHHNLGGGTDEYFKESLLPTYKTLLVQFFDRKINSYVIEFFYKGIKEENRVKVNAKELIENLENVISFFNIKKIIIKHVYGYPNILGFIEFISNIKKRFKNLEYEFMLHDFLSICPIHNLLDYKGKYCNIPDIDYCKECIINNSLLKELNPYVMEEKNISISEWREIFKKFLINCDRIYCFSNSSKNILKKAYPDIFDEKIIIKPHTVNWVVPINIKKNKERKVINIGVIGNINYSKGITIINELITTIHQKKLPFKIYIFGDIDVRRGISKVKKLVLYGPYNKYDLSLILEKK